LISENFVPNFATQVTKTRSAYHSGHRASSLVMLFALAWLTVSLPFVYKFQEEQKALTEQGSERGTECSNPLANTTEEKSEGGVTNLSEFLHELHHAHYPHDELLRHRKLHSSDLYFAFHPELISPPPEV
jgi:hypothetical protein